MLASAPGQPRELPWSADWSWRALKAAESCGTVPVSCRRPGPAGDAGKGGCQGISLVRRVDCCDSCKCYVKAVAVLDALTPDGVIEEDLATAPLDVVAVERGYHR